VSPWPPPLTVTDEDVAWARRARRYRDQVANYCQLCERRYVQIHLFTLLLFTLHPRLEVHHRCGRGVRSAVGWEDNDELMTLCVPCHQRITTEHRRLARLRKVAMKDVLKHDTPKYARIIAEVTAAARPRYIARAFRRMLIDRPPQTQGVIIPRR